MTYNFWYRHSQPLGRLQVYTHELSSHVSVTYLVYFLFYFILSSSNWDYESVRPNRKLNLITWWICFFLLKKVDRRSAIIHVFTKTPPTQRSRKVVRYLFLYRAPLTNVNISVWMSSIQRHEWTLRFDINIKKSISSQICIRVVN